MKDYRIEEEILKDYTAETDIDKIYEKEWNTAEVVELMRKAIENCTINGVVKSLPDKTVMTIDESIILLKKALRQVAFVNKQQQTDFILDIVNEYKKQLK